MGDNSSGLLDSSEREARFFNHLNPIWTVEQQLDQLKAQKTKLKRLAKADGFEAYEIDFGLKIRKAEKADTIDNEMARRIAVARFMNQPLGHQVDIFDADRRPDEDRAFDDGLQMGLRGESLRNPHSQAVPQWKAMNDGWREGQDRLLADAQRRMEEQNQKAAETASTSNGNGEKRPRGRPKGSKNKGKPEGGKPFSQQMKEHVAEGDRKIDEAATQ